MKEFITTERINLKEFTDNHYAQASFYWNYLLKNKEIKVNGKKTGANITLNVGDKVVYFLTPKQQEKQAFKTLYEDDNIYVIDKESGVNSEAVFCALEEKGECYFIHRLDRNTAGVMVFAKTREAESELLEAFKGRQVEKIYQALCLDRFSKDKNIIKGYLKKDADKSTVQVYDSFVPHSEEIETEYEVEERINNYAKVKVILHTGKTHQIRAHLAHIGCPILGDEKYGNSELNHSLNLTRQCLVSKTLRLNCSGVLSYLASKTFESSFNLDLQEITK